MKKLQLNTIKIQSFVTEDINASMGTVKGGANSVLGKGNAEPDTLMISRYLVIRIGHLGTSC